MFLSAAIFGKTLRICRIIGTCEFVPVASIAVILISMKAGFGQADITPAIGCNIGSVRPRVMSGVHDPLLASACVIDDGATPVALVGIDVSVITRPAAEAVMRAIAQRTGIPR